MCCFSSKQEA